MRLSVAAAWLLAGVMSSGCGRVSAPSDGPRASLAPSSASAWFTDEAAATGLAFHHDNGMTGELYLAEIMGAGVGLLDYDRDGDLDVYVVQGAALDGRPRVFPLPAGPPGDRLFRNDLTRAANGAPRLRFTDVTADAGIDVHGYGMGVAAGDADNDGWTDLLVLQLGGLRLLRNTTRGGFADVTARSGLAAPSWPVSASFVDVDRDGALDLYLANYVTYRIEADTDCYAASGAPAYCSPRSYRSEPDRLYRNRGDGTFVDVTSASGIAAADGPGLGVVATDVDGDGWPDLYVANDGTANLLWINQRNGRFVDTALVAGVAVSGDGRPEGSMGVDAADVDGDGDEELFMTNIAGEGHDQFENTGGGLFEDRSAVVGLGSATLPFTGFGAAWLDADNDGRLDLLAVSGAIQPIEAQVRAGDRHPLRQRAQLLRNVGGRYEDVTAAAGAALTTPSVGRGAAFGDVDNDGDTDVVVTSNNGPIQLLVNHRGNGQHWLGLRFVDRHGRPDRPGVRVAIERQVEPATIRRRAHADGSYASSNDPRVLVGLGAAEERPRVRVTWPSGTAETWPALDIDRWHELKEGTGQ